MLMLHILGPVYELLLGGRLVYTGSDAAWATMHLRPVRLLITARLDVRLHSGTLLRGSHWGHLSLRCCLVLLLCSIEVGITGGRLRLLHDSLVMVIHLGLLIEQLLKLLDLLLASQHALLIGAAGCCRTVIVGPRLVGLVHSVTSVVRSAIWASEVHQPHRLSFDCLD